MIHTFKQGTIKKVLIGLHGTGGNEVDFMHFAERIDSRASILSIRGNVSEHGMNRFFKRFGMGLYDLESYEEETANLANAIKDLSNKYNFDLVDATVVGFSNGANIALGLLQDYPNLLNNYMLLSPDYINPLKGFKDLTNKNIFISTAKNDPYSNFDKTSMMIELMEQNNAKVEVHLGHGHQIDMDVLNNLIKWFNN